MPYNRPPTQTWHETSYPAISSLNPSLSTAGKVVVVTGGGSGIGQSILRSFARAGSTEIATIGRTEATLDSTRLALQADFPTLNLLTYVADVTDEQAIQNAFGAIQKVYGHVDILVCNAGYLPDLEPIESGSVSEFWKGFDVNFKGPYNVVKSFLPLAAPEAVVINVSSGMALVPPVRGFASYASSKLAGIKFFEYIQAEQAGFRVFSLQPGIVSTPQGLKGVGSNPIYEKLAVTDASLPADCCVWLASRDATFLKGKFIYANWDVEELKQMGDAIAGSDLFTVRLHGLSPDNFGSTV